VPAERQVLRIPAAGLVALVGPRDNAKAAFTRSQFAASELVAEHTCRDLVADAASADERQTIDDARELVHHVVEIRLRRRLLTVVDVVSLDAGQCRQLIRLADRHDLPFEALALAPQPQHLDRLRADLRAAGLRRVQSLNGAAIAAATVERDPLPSDRQHVSGPFDVIGDVHGCLATLLRLLAELGWRVQHEKARAIEAAHPEGRTAVFVGDLVGPGPDSIGVLRLVMAMTAAGAALCVSGDHEDRIVRAMDGSAVVTSHPLAETLAQLSGGSKTFRKEALRFMRALPSHLLLDDGRLAVAHAGAAERYLGRCSARERAFSIYGDRSANGGDGQAAHPPPWTADYAGSATVVYGHAVVDAPRWINNTVCLATGVAHGGSLTALRYPERRLVSTPAGQRRSNGHRAEPPPPHGDDWTLNVNDIGGGRWIDTAYAGRVRTHDQAAAAALEVMSRFGADPRWLVYLPPTIAPCAPCAPCAPSSPSDAEFLDHPDGAFDEYAAAGLAQVVCEERQAATRAVAVLARDESAAARRFQIADGTTGIVYTRIGRPLAVGDDWLDRLRGAAEPLFESLRTDWLVLDLELQPSSAFALEVVKHRQAAAACAARHTLGATHAALRQATARGLDVDDVAARADRRLAGVEALRDAYLAQCGHPSQGGAVTARPLQILAAEGRVLPLGRPHTWQLSELARLDGDVIAPASHRVVDLASRPERAEAVRWWLALSAAGSGMVVRPAGQVDRAVQPAIAVRGREQLRLVYGPDYLDHLDDLRARNLERTRALTIREHGLALEGLRRFVGREPLTRVHEAIFGVLAVQSEPGHHGCNL
jgi:polynucleotide kinase-phosphatase